MEDVVLEMVIYFYEKTRLDSLCLAGGVAMNSKMNGRILQESPFKNVWLPSSADDAGCSLGACFFYWNQVLGNKRQFVLEHDYWGPGFTNEDVKNALDCINRISIPSLTWFFVKRSLKDENDL